MSPRRKTTTTPKKPTAPNRKPTGRPAKDANGFYQLRLSDSDRAHWQPFADQAGMSLAEFIRATTAIATGGKLTPIAVEFKVSYPNGGLGEVLPSFAVAHELPVTERQVVERFIADCQASPTCKLIAGELEKRLRAFDAGRLIVDDPHDPSRAEPDPAAVAEWYGRAQQIGRRSDVSVSSADLSDERIAEWAGGRPSNPITADGVYMALEIRRRRESSEARELEIAADEAARSVGSMDW
jgi:hypothetical protein